MVIGDEPHRFQRAQDRRDFFHCRAPEVPGKGARCFGIGADRSVGQGQQMQREAFRVCQFAEVSVMTPAYEVNVESDLTQLKRERRQRIR